MYIDIEQYMEFLLVMLRMTGMIVFHPIMGRRTIPTMMSMGLALTLTVLITRVTTFAPLPELNLFNFFYMALMELAVGLVAGSIVRMFISVMTDGGELIDMQNGLGMAKSFDPSTNMSVSVTANIFNVFFIFIFFATNNHLTFIYMTSQTFRIIPLGATSINPQVFYYLPELFATVFLLTIKLCLPIVAVEMVATVAVGIIMRIIPQINIFVVNIQLKLIIGLFSVIVLIAPIIAFMENLIMLYMERIQEAWTYFIPV